MTKTILIIAGCVALGAFISGCSKVRRSPGRAYMPDMYYSRAYETYASTEKLREKGINYNAMPVSGTIARGDTYVYPLKNDSASYIQSASITNPLPALNAKDNLEAARLYLINCAICHGDKLDGNGPLFKGGDGPYQAAPKNFMADDMKAMTAGTMFHSVTYGKGQMGSYASQLNPQQRWMIIHYIKEKQQLATQPGTSAVTQGADTTGATQGADTTRTTN
jgi:mono/diheme cytochrome c family protein